LVENNFVCNKQTYKTDNNEICSQLYQHQNFNRCTNTAIGKEMMLLLFVSPMECKKIKEITERTENKTEKER
jgi:hypothetical protein